MLKLSGVSASYGSVPAITNVSIEIGEGEAVGLLGANGAGKSTTLRAISGQVHLTSGTVSFAGTDLSSLPPASYPPLPEGGSGWEPAKTSPESQVLTPPSLVGGVARNEPGWVLRSTP